MPSPTCGPPSLFSLSCPSGNETFGFIVIHISNQCSAVCPIGTKKKLKNRSFRKYDYKARLFTAPFMAYGAFHCSSLAAVFSNTIIHNYKPISNFKKTKLVRGWAASSATGRVAVGPNTAGACFIIKIQFQRSFN